MPDSDLANEIRRVGEEYGATTGRPRQINWFDVDAVSRAVDINGVDKLIINKVDVLESLCESGDYLRVYHGDSMFSFDSMEVMTYYIEEHVGRKGEIEMLFSGDKDRI